MLDEVISLLMLSVAINASARSSDEPGGSPAHRPANSTLESTPETRFTLSITSSTEKPRP
jgi:hypothetical protein